MAPTSSGAPGVRAYLSDYRPPHRLACLIFLPRVTARSLPCFICRNLTSLTGETQYVVCAVAKDAFLNTGSEVTALRFSTLDGTPPALTLRATPRGPPADAVDGLCRATVQLSVSEPGSGAVIAVRADVGLQNWLPGELLARADSRDAAMQASILDEARFESATSAPPVVQPLRVPCDTELQVIAAMADVQGNEVDEVQSVTITTPDILPPRFVLDTPRVEFASSETATFGVALDEAGRVVLEVRACACQTCTCKLRFIIGAACLRRLHSMRSSAALLLLE